MSCVFVIITIVLYVFFIVDETSYTCFLSLTPVLSLFYPFLSIFPPDPAQGFLFVNKNAIQEGCHNIYLQINTVKSFLPFKTQKNR